MSEDLRQRFQTFWEDNFTDIGMTDNQFIVAVSGGADSVVLAHIMQQLKMEFVIVHCNFQLRGEDSDADEILVKQYAAKFGKKLLVKYFDTKGFAQKNKMGIEEAARKLRYDWFAELSQKQDLFPILKGIYPHPVVIAHHANDNVETVLFHLLRGTGIRGLHGILPRNATILRPLLFALKKEIVRYALAHRLAWREDQSNRDPHFARNFLRLQVIPEIKEHFPQFDQIMLDNIQRFSASERIYEKGLELYKNELLHSNADGYCIEIASFKKVAPLQQTLLHEWGKKWDLQPPQNGEIIKLLDAENGAQVRTLSHVFTKDRGKILIAPIRSENRVEFFTVEKIVDSFAFAGSQLTFHAAENFLPPHNKFSVQVDAALLHFPLTIRHWDQGDYFCPLGMRGKKKISDFFIDNKLSIEEKKQVWLLISAGEIVWIIGHRLDNRFKVTAKTKKICEIQYQK